MTGELLGEATITYKDTATQRTALETYNNQMYQVQPLNSSNKLLNLNLNSSN